MTGELRRRGQGGWPRRFPIVQFPNWPLLVGLAGWVLAAASSGTTHDLGRAVFGVGVGVWAWLEAISGVNWLRRLLGVGVLLWIAARLIDNL